jgi:hypothetical protein
MLDLEDRRVRIGAIAGLCAVILLGVFLVARECWPRKLPSGRWQRPPRPPAMAKP